MRFKCLKNNGGLFDLKRKKSSVCLLFRDSLVNSFSVKSEGRRTIGVKILGNVLQVSEMPVLIENTFFWQSETVSNKRSWFSLKSLIAIKSYFSI